MPKTPPPEPKKRGPAEPVEKKKRGRPKGRKRIQRQMGLTPELWAWLEAQKREGESLPDCIERLLNLLRLVGGAPSVVTLPANLWGWINNQKLPHQNPENYLIQLLHAVVELEKKINPFLP